MTEDVRNSAYQEGRRAGLALAALAASLVAFLSLLGLEKALLAMALAYLASRGAVHSSRSRRLAGWALLISLLYTGLFATVLIVFHAKLAEIIRLLQQLG